MRPADHTSLGKYEDEGRQPSAEFLAGFALFTGVDGHWLLTGEGEMVRQGDGEAQWRLQRVREALEAPYVNRSDVDDALAAAAAEKAAGRDAAQDVAG